MSDEDLKKIDELISVLKELVEVEKERNLYISELLDVEKEKKKVMDEACSYGWG